ncbi:hypothetical protein BACERE00185_04531 [Bacillus mobilis]|uniref:Uncharacterized protein n=1 Tax=Bacillus mobilis TaxID=2026190 RepID=A0A1Y6AGJ4_9BACI|nr:hypothetical protein [Bacillus mobilis]SME38954.1 hypothetical protein BACERE00185_04531 [Bacillus mobilis]
MKKGKEIGQSRRSSACAINLVNSSNLSDEVIANSLEMGIKHIPIIRKIKDGNISAEEVVEVFGADV